jgi:peptidylprolyl isomerase
MDKPDVGPITGEPPAELLIEDITVGEGDEAEPGRYVSGEPFQVPLGGGQVIQGWDRGVAGMRVGGRRRLTVPPELGYGSRGAGGVIKPNETLIFVVDLLGVQ